MALAYESMPLDEFLELPEQKPYLEYENGVITEKVSPKMRHSSLVATLQTFIDAIGRASRIARAFPELRFTVAGLSVVPDLSIFDFDRIPRDSAGMLLDDITIPPDAVFEIASPGQSTMRLTRRCVWYVSNGVRIAFLVDPDDLSVLAFRPDRPVQVLRGADQIDISELIPGFMLTVSELFEALR